MHLIFYQNLFKNISSNFVNLFTHFYSPFSIQEILYKIPHIFFSGFLTFINYKN